MNYNITMDFSEYEDCIIALLKEADKYNDDTAYVANKVAEYYIDAGVSPNKLFESIRYNEVLLDTIDGAFSYILGNDDYAKIISEEVGKEITKFSEVPSNKKQDVADRLISEVEGIVSIDVDEDKVVYETF